MHHLETERRSVAVQTGWGLLKAWGRPTVNVDNEGQCAVAELPVLGQVEIQPLADMAVGGVLDVFEGLGAFWRHKRGRLEVPHEIGCRLHVYSQQQASDLGDIHVFGLVVEMDRNGDYKTVGFMNEARLGQGPLQHCKSGASYGNR